MNCARYLGGKHLLNNRAWRTFSWIDPTARGSEWTVRQVKENDHPSCCHGRPPLEKKVLLYVEPFYNFISLRLPSLVLIGGLVWACPPPPSYENKFLQAPMVAVTSWICQRVIFHFKLHVCAYFLYNSNVITSLYNCAFVHTKDRIVQTLFILGYELEAQSYNVDNSIEMYNERIDTFWSHVIQSNNYPMLSKTVKHVLSI